MPFSTILLLLESHFICWGESIQCIPLLPESSRCTVESKQFWISVSREYAPYIKQKMESVISVLFAVQTGDLTIFLACQCYRMFQFAYSQFQVFFAMVLVFRNSKGVYLPGITNFGNMYLLMDGFFTLNRPFQLYGFLNNILIMQSYQNRFMIHFENLTLSPLSWSST